MQHNCTKMQAALAANAYELAHIHTEMEAVLLNLLARTNKEKKTGVNSEG